MIDAIILLLFEMNKFAESIINTMPIMLDRTIAPLSKQIPSFEFPEYTKHQLSNGCVVIVIEDNNQPLVNITLSMRLGAAHETIPGLAKCAGSLLMSGTPTKTADQISLESDIIGVSIGVNSGWDSTEFTGFGLAEYLPNMLSIMSDSFFNAIFPVNEVQKKKDLLIADCEFLSVDPEYLATRACTSILYGNHAYSHARNGTPTSIFSIQQEDCLRWKEMLLESGNPFFTVSGNCNTKEVLNYLEKHFGHWKPGKEVHELSSPIYGQGIQCVYAPKADAVQTSLHIAFPSIGIKHEDYTLFQLASTMFGGYFASRINLTLREKYGYTYGAFSYTDSRKYSSSYNIQTNVGNDVTKHSIELLLEEMSAFHKAIIDDEEFTTASQYLLGTLVQGMETAQQISGRARTIEFNGLSPDYFTKKFDDLSHATTDALSKIQQTYFKPDHMIIAASGNGELLESIMKEFGDVIVFEEA